MKKLLLPIIAISLIGCSPLDRSWTKVEEQGISVVFGEHMMGYTTSEYDNLFYAISGTNLLSVYVKYRYTPEDNYKIDKYIGTNVSLVVWG